MSQITNNNKLIHEFMEMQGKVLPYNKSWDLLIPAYVKANTEIKSVVKNGRIDRKAENYVYLCRSEILSDNKEKVTEYLANAIELHNKIKNS